MLDTWFSSALWPFATLGWPEETPQLRAFYPTAVLSTARDILFLWVARMIMMGLRFTGDVPFSDVYIHSVIQAPDGRRMSKSLGTGIDPLRRDRPPRRRRGALRAAGDVLLPGRALLRREGAPGAGARQQAVQRRALRAAAGRGVCPVSTWTLVTRGRDPGLAGAGPRRHRYRGPLDPLAPAGGHRRHRGADRGLRLLARRARAVRLRVRGAVRLVPGDRQAAAGRSRETRASGEHPRFGQRDPGGSGAEAACGPRGARRDAAVRAARDGRARAPGDPVRDRGAVVLSRRLGRAARGLALPAGRRGADRPRRRDRAGARDRGGHARARAGGTPWPRRPGAVVPARVRADGYESTAAILADLARLDLSESGASGGAEPVASISVPCGTVEVLSARASTSRRAARRRAAARAKLGGEIAPRAGRSSPTPASWSARLRRSSRASGPSSLACKPNWRRCERAAGDAASAAAGSTPARCQRRAARRAAVERRACRASPALAGAVRDALRPRPRAAHDDRARLPAAALPRGARGGHQRQDLDDADDRGDPRSATGCAPAPTSPRTWSPTQNGCRWASATSRVRPSRPRSRARRGRRSASTARSPPTTTSPSSSCSPPRRFWALAERGVEVAVVEAGLGGPLRRDRGGGVAGDGAHHRRPRAHPLAGADGARHRRGEARGAAPRRDARARRGPPPRRARASPVRRRRSGGARLVQVSAERGRGRRRLHSVAFQRRNFALARVAAEAYLADAGSQCARTLCSAAALAATVVGDACRSWPSDPLTVLDGAHNPDAARALVESLPADARRGPLGLVMGVLEDKDAAAMLAALLPLCTRAWFTAPPSSRALSPAALQSLARQLGFEEALCEPHPRRALELAQEWARAQAGRGGAGDGLDLPGGRPVGGACRAAGTAPPGTPAGRAVARGGAAGDAARGHA